MPEDASFFASTSLPRHLTRGAVGFGLIGSAFALTTTFGLAALLLAPPDSTCSAVARCVGRSDW